LLTGAPENVRSGLEAIEELPGGSWTDAGGANGIEDLAERDLDGVAIYQGGEFERLFVGSALALRVAVAWGVKEAVGHAAKGRRVALDAVGLDMAAFMEHTPPTCTDSFRKSGNFNDLQRDGAVKF
jgi:hypothetical protein